MIDYQLSEAEERIQQDMAGFCQAEIGPRSRLLDECPRTDVAEHVRTNLRTLAGANLLSLGVAETGIDMVGHYLAGEELAKACASTFLSARASTFLCGGLLHLFGSDEQKQAYLPGLLSGDRIGALAYSEDGAGTDMAGIDCVAAESAGDWLIAGEKNTVVNAAIADIMIVLAYTDKDAAPSEGMSLCLVEKGARGLAVGAPVETMGVRGAPVSPVTMTDCACAGILGTVPGRGYGQVKRILEMGAVGIAALCVGIGMSCMEKSTAYAKQRQAGGIPIGLHQEIGFKLADMFWNTDIARVLSLRAAWAYNRNEDECEILAACARLFAGEAVTKIADGAMHVFAGHGYMKGADIERLYRDARFGEICEGTTELQRSFIARNELDRFVRP